jgi:vacuolar-type H+-ATPase subunit H
VATVVSQQRTDEVRQAMDQVLEAEREAQAEIDRAHDRVREMLRQARDDVRRIEERARLRQARIHAACDARAESHIETLRREAGLVAAEPSNTSESDLVAAACRRLAAILTEPS